MAKHIGKHSKENPEISGADVPNPETPSLNLPEVTSQQPTQAAAPTDTDTFVMPETTQATAAWKRPGITPAQPIEKAKSGSSFMKAFWITLASVVGLVVVAYVAASVFFMSHFGFNTTVGGVDVSLKTVAEAKELIKDHTTGYSIKVLERTNTDESIQGTAIGLEYHDDDVVDTYLANQNHWTWPLRLKDFEEPGELRVNVKFDEAKLTEAITALKCMDPAAMVAPADAFPEFDGTQYVVHPEVLGTTLDQATVTTAVSKAITNTENTVDLEAAGAYVAPQIISTTPELVQRVNTYNTYVPFSVTYTFGETNEVVSAETIISWLIIAPDGTATLDEELIKAWVKDFAARHDTVGTTRELVAPDGETYSVSGGIYGWKVDQEAEVAALIEACNTKESQTREPHYKSRAASYGSPDWGNSYIDVNLTKQHIWYVKDGQVIFEADVVTGTPVPKRQTTEGVWMILDKRSPYTLTGEILPSTGEPEYKTPVRYWMRVTWTGIGFHDATWQPWFGGSRYLNNGSHGCINMSYSEAQELYSLVYVDLPVIVHK